MTRKRVWRYYCEHCKKSGGSAYHLREHEKHCTGNPERECRVCQMDRADVDRGEGEQRPMAELLAVLPEPKALWWDPGSKLYRNYGQYEKWKAEQLADAMERLRELTQNCPACIFAALRQKGFHTSEAGFDYKAEMDEIWKEIRFCNAQAEYPSYHG